MHSILVPAATALVAIFLLRFIYTVIIYGLFPEECTCKKNHILIRDLSKATAILKSSTLQSRAPPNQRLVSVFFISNAFTTTDQVVYNSFVAEAKDLLKTSSDDLVVLAHNTLRLSQNISWDPSIERIHLNSLIQLVCFRFVLLKFFPFATVFPCSDSSILRITGLINALWISSKCSCSTGHSYVSMQNSLQHEICSLFPHLEKENNENPLNIIIPAYETLWRVVLRCFLEITFLKPSEVTTQWKKIIHEFLQNISPKQFSKRKGRCSAEAIVFESLRLYPPTKRIYRQNQRDGWIAAIDVEYLQRAGEIWGSDGGEFKPERWSELESTGNTTYKEAWMPFGKPSFQCPASKVAPMMIAMLVACLVETFGNGEWLLEDLSGDNETLSQKTLDNGRGAFESVFLRRFEAS